MAIGKKTGGRTKGVPNKATAAKLAEVAASGLTPMDFLLKVMRDKKEQFDRRIDAAKSVAPYVHPKIASIDPVDGGSQRVRVNFVLGVPRLIGDGDE